MPGHPPRSAVLSAALSALVLGVAGCGDSGRSAPASGGELLTEEVPPPPDALVDPTTDEQEKRRSEAMAGVLPSDVPSSLPAYPGSSLVDFGAEGASRYIVLLTADPPSAARGGYESRLAAAGWERSGGNRWAHGGEEIDVAVAAAPGAGSEIRVGY